MNRNILAFADRRRAPGGERAPLRPVWTATGNPKQPLACRWVAGENRSCERDDSVSGRRHALCA